MRKECEWVTSEKKKHKQSINIVRCATSLIIKEIKIMSINLKKIFKVSNIKYYYNFYKN